MQRREGKKKKKQRRGERVALSPCRAINQPAAAERERMAMDWPTHPPPALVPAVVSAGAVLVSYYVFNAAAQIPDPAVRLYFL